MFKPRYSLLTLFLLTALVAGGVKLWRGPHRVVEQPKANMEIEYSYWRGLADQRILEGPHIERLYDVRGELHCVDISNYRVGTILGPHYLFMIDPRDYKQRSFPNCLQKELLNDREKHEFLQVILRERKRIQDLDLGKEILEGYYFQ